MCIRVSAFIIATMLISFNHQLTAADLAPSLAELEFLLEWVSDDGEILDPALFEDGGVYEAKGPEESHQIGDSEFVEEWLDD